MTLTEVRQSLTPEAIINILAHYNVHPVVQNTNAIIFPTCCHNVSGGSAKLYYYIQSNLFHCFTECNASFDIFELITKIEKLRNGLDIPLWQALSIAGINPASIQDAVDNTEYNKTLDYMYQFKNTVYEIQNPPAIDESVLRASLFNTDVLAIWESEGITLSVMQKYRIGYDPINNCITIPIFSDNGDLISVRGRYLAEDANVKYKPISFGNKILSAPSSQILYGLYQTQEAIQKSKTAIIFESEKSVLMMDSYYGNKNNSVATLGKNISNQHIMLLRKLGVEEVILAYDADYSNEQQTQQKFLEYTEIAKTLAPFFSTSIIMDWKHVLPYKASPIDCGKELFEKLLKERYYVKF